MKPQITVVIGTYNQRENLKLVLASLLEEQTLDKSLYEVIAVDSSSTDGTEEMAEEFTSTHTNFRYIRQENKGRPGARNRGINEALGDIILITDADMIADKNLLSEHLEAHNKTSKSAFEGKTCNFNWNILNEKFQLNGKSLDRVNFKRLKSEKSLATLSEPYIKERVKNLQKIRWSYFLTGNLSIRKELIIKAGLFDESFAGYGWEDVELGYRIINKMGIPLYYLENAINYHNHPMTDTDEISRKYNMGVSAIKFYQKYRNLEVSLFLGINPIATAVYKFIKAFKPIQTFLKNASEKSSFFRYIYSEFLYRDGFESMSNV